MIDRQMLIEINQMVRLLLEGVAKQCEHPKCDKIFRIDPDHPNKRFCPKSCGRNVSTRRCVCCNKEYILKKNGSWKYCSPTCSAQAATQSRKVRPSIASCQRPGCNKTYTSYYSRKKYCSKHCREWVSEMAKYNIRQSRKETRTCTYYACTATFTTTDPRKKYCSPLCNKRHQSHTNHQFPETVTCLTCKNEFPFNQRVPNKKFCSVECKDAHTPVKKECGFCKGSFYTAPRRKRFFCTPGCAKEHQKKQQIKLRESRRRTCQNPNCAKEFIPDKSSNLFCGRACYGETLRGVPRTNLPPSREQSPLIVEFAGMPSVGMFEMETV